MYYERISRPMRIIISPAKKMNVDTDSLAWEALPQFLPQTEQLKNKLQKMSAKQLQALWKCNDAIAKLNVDRLRTMDLQKNLTPAILSYQGIQYQYMAPDVFEYGEYDFVQQHLRILSGFYGMVCPFDGVVPYRLEMQAKLAVGKHKDLYAFWHNTLAAQLEGETDFIINLASKEYSKALLPHLSVSTFVLSCTFAQIIDRKVTEKGTMCKMARGEFVRWMAENNVTTLQDIASFDRLGYQYNKELSTPNNAVFIK